MKEWYCTIKGVRYGPVSDEELRRWVQEGRLKPNDSLWSQGMAAWVPAAGVPGIFTPEGAPPLVLQPHRGATVLTLGILGLTVCVICGIIAWIMGRNDLREMDAGRMDPSGRGMTNAGRICGIVNVCLAAVGLLFLMLYLVIIMFVVVGAAAGAR